MTTPNYFYGTIPSLAWVLGHYFYGKHFLWASSEFYPHKLKNPRSSSPFKIYEDIYEPWREQDEFSKQISGLRLALIGGVDAKHSEGAVDDRVAERLRRICDRVSISFFYPVVCRVNVDVAIKDRALVEGSGKVGSSELLFQDLDETEIDSVLFLDFSEDEDFRRIVREEYYFFRENNRRLLEGEEVMTILEGRCDSSGLRLPASIIG